MEVRVGIVGADGRPIGSGKTDELVNKPEFNPPKGLRDSPIGNESIRSLAMKNFGGRLKQAASGALYTTGYRAKKALINKAKSLPKSSARFARRAALGTIAGGSMAMLAAGIAATTGDPSKAAALMAAGGATGSNFANYHGDKIANAFGSVGSAALASGRTGFWGKDTKAIDQYKFDKEVLESPELMDTLTKSLGSREAAREAIKDGSVQALLNNNITDISAIGKSVKMAREFERGKDEKGNVIGRKYSSTGRSFKLSKDEALVRGISMAKWKRDFNPAILIPHSEEQEKFRSNMSREGYSKQQIDEILEDLEYHDI